MSNQWFRMYSDVLSNSKVQILTEALRWRYVALLCLHCKESYINTPDDEIALSLRIDVDEWLKTKDTLIKRKLLNEDGSISGWEKRQFISDLKDPTAATRQKRYRENKAKDRNATVTSHLPESETDTEIKDKSFTGAVVVTELFEFWKSTLSHDKARLDTKREKAIKNALTLGYSIDDLKAAIVGCSKTPHNMGQNDRGEKYDSIDLIFRDADHIDRFIRNSGQSKALQQVPANDSLSRYKVVGGGK